MFFADFKMAAAFLLLWKSIATRPLLKARQID
jgi:hypothetical protein